MLAHELTTWIEPGSRKIQYIVSCRVLAPICDYLLIIYLLIFLLRFFKIPHFLNCNPPEININVLLFLNIYHVVPVYQDNTDYCSGGVQILNIKPNKQGVFLSWGIMQP